jgi:uncharacterized membrane protein
MLIPLRCTQDMSAIEERFSYNMTHFIWTTLKCISVLAAGVFTVGLWALIPGMVIFVLGLALGLIYLRCQISVTREMK